ncbi:MAG: DUF2808 domain-containing protein [Geitlerinemataceae cyanobacterium]
MNRTLSVALASITLSAAALFGSAIPKAAAEGFVLFGGPGQGNTLDFALDYGSNGHPRDRYRLRIPATKMTFAVSQFSIEYPDYYDGEFDIELDEDLERRLRRIRRQPVRVRIKEGRSYEDVEVETVIWDEENHVIDIFPKEPVPAGQKVEIVLSNVSNPRFGGMYFFNARAFSPGDLPIARYLGTWVIGIGN